MLRIIFAFIGIAAAVASCIGEACPSRGDALLQHQLAHERVRTGGYELGGDNTQSCGYQRDRIHTPTECRDAAAVLGLPYGYTGSCSGWPRYCFTYRDLVYFNEDAVNSASRNDARLVCERVEPTTTTTTTTILYDNVVSYVIGAPGFDCAEGHVVATHAECASSELITQTGIHFSNWASTNRMMFCAILIWCTFIMYGRLYLGMHSPIDVARCRHVLLRLHVYAAVDDFIDAWMTATTVFVPAYQLAFAVVLCWTYPQGLQRTPSYNYAVYFTGVCLGVVTGVWRCPHHHSVAAAEAIKAVRGPLASTGFMLFVGRRFLVGLVVVLALRAASKEILKLLVPRVFQILGIPCSDHEAKPKEEKDPVGYNVLTPTRLLNYAVVGWTVVEPCFDLFEWLRI